MGTSKRYAAYYDQRMDEKILVRTAAGGKLQSLGQVELELHTLALTVDPKPERVKAWVRSGETPILVDAVAERWTPRAIGIMFMVGEKEYRTWVWASAVDQART